MTVAVVLLAILLLVCLLALVDQYRTLEIVRAELGLNDAAQSIPIENGRELPPSGAGLPAELDEQPQVFVLFLSTMCATCQTIAKRLRADIPAGVQPVLVARSPEEAATWLSGAGMPQDQVVIDEGGRIASALGIDVSPSAVIFQRGQIRSASTVPSYRRFQSLLAEYPQPATVESPHG
ncbi:TlpA family protein disulfide reductase [Nonomuraea typhae]|uniref:TlpA family protein disulfide reductase n=1 Tax=Nonomuraea typhae TaxID=2603600 RepID=A0ABW7YLE4_9ACTN